MAHSADADYLCKVCHMMVRPPIVHECNYMICFACKGTTVQSWRDNNPCQVCEGTGKWTERKELPNE